MLTNGELYSDLGGDYLTRRDPERQRMLRSAIFLTHEQGCPVRSNCSSSPFRESIGVDDVAVYGPEQRQICRVSIVPMEGERVSKAANGSLIP